MNRYKVDVRDITPETLEEILWSRCKTVWFKDKNIWRKDANGVLINWEKRNFKACHIIPLEVVDIHSKIFKELREKFEFRLFNYQLDSLETIDKFKGDTALFHGTVGGNYWIELKRMRDYTIKRFALLIYHNLEENLIHWE